MPFNGGGFSGGGFGRNSGGGVGAPAADPWAGTASGLSQQTTGVAAYGNVWASNACAPCNVAIQQLQAQVNRATAAIGRPAGLHIDGKVGQGTANAVQLVQQAAHARGMLAESLQLARVGNSPELVAKNADWVAPIVGAVADKIGATNQATAPTNFPVVTGGGQMPVVSPPPGTPGMPATPPGMQVSAMPGIFAPGTKWRARLPYLIGGVVLVIGAGVTVLILTSPSARAHADDDEE